MGPRALGHGARPCRNELFVDRQIPIDHAVDRKPAGDELAACRPGGEAAPDALRHLFNVAADKSVHAILDNLFDGSAGERENRRAARHRFDHDEAERLLPLNREEERPRSREQPIFLRRIRFADVLDLAAVDVWSDFVLPVGLEDRLDLAGDLQPDPRKARGLDRQVRSLARRDAAEEGDVVVLRG